TDENRYARARRPTAGSRATRARHRPPRTEQPRQSADDRQRSPRLRAEIGVDVCGSITDQSPDLDEARSLGGVAPALQRRARHAELRREPRLVDEFVSAAYRLGYVLVIRSGHELFLGKGGFGHEPGPRSPQVNGVDTIECAIARTGSDVTSHRLGAAVAGGSRSDGTAGLLADG